MNWEVAEHATDICVCVEVEIRVIFGAAKILVLFLRTHQMSLLNCLNCNKYGGEAHDHND